MLRGGIGWCEPHRRLAGLNLACRKQFMMTTSTALANLQDVLDARGLQAGLLFLNARVPHRFTSVYRLSDQRLRRLSFVDKEGGLGAETEDVPFKDSFCEVAVREGHLVVTDLPTDARLHDQPNPLMLGSYVGLPLSRGPGVLYGTFCHYDTCAHPLSDDELVFLEQASQLLARFCLRPGMPLHALATA
jgi:GAF domain-containing protein